MTLYEITKWLEERGFSGLDMAVVETQYGEAETMTALKDESIRSFARRIHNCNRIPIALYGSNPVRLKEPKVCHPKPETLSTYLGQHSGIIAEIFRRIGENETFIEKVDTHYIEKYASLQRRVEELEKVSLNQGAHMGDLSERISEVEKYLLHNQKTIDPEIQKVLKKKFWDCLA